MGEAEKLRRRGDIMLNWAKKSGLGMATGRDFKSTTGETDRETGEFKARIGQASHTNPKPAFQRCSEPVRLSGRSLESFEWRHSFVIRPEFRYIHYPEAMGPNRSVGRPSTQTQFLIG